MTDIIVATFFFALSIANFIFAGKKWRETQSEWWVIAIFINMFLLLLFGWWIKLIVFDYWGL